MNIEFCPELQVDWSIESISFQNLSEVKVVLVESVQEDYPDSQGRHGKDVLSWPNIYTEKQRAEFYFNNCVYFNVRDDVAPGLSENDEGEGKTFQRLMKSELLQLHSNRAIENLNHYRIIGANEIVDILSYETPDIVQRKIT